MLTGKIYSVINSGEYLFIIVPLSFMLNFILLSSNNFLKDFILIISWNSWMMDSRVQVIFFSCLLIKSGPSLENSERTLPCGVEDLERAPPLLLKEFLASSLRELMSRFFWEITSNGLTSSIFYPYIFLLSYSLNPEF